LPAAVGQRAIPVQYGTKVEDVLIEDKWKQLKDELGAEREETLGEISRFRAVLKNELDADPEEGDPDLYEREKTLALLRNLEEKLYSLTHALAKIDDGTYGNCEICGEDIGVERLEALPYTAYCLKCKSLVEKGIVFSRTQELAR
jgi:RNA polymerase-binding protein DksA